MEYNELVSKFHYSRSTGLFTRRSSGKVSCCKYSTKDGQRYVHISLNSKNYKAHRMAWLYCFGEMPVNDIDHIDGDGTNNKIENLRDVEKTINSRNAKLARNNKSGCCGVRWRQDKSKWIVQITIMGKRAQLGSFDNLLDAACCRKSKEIKNGFTVRHGR